MSKRKKLFIFLGVVIGIIGLLILLSFTVFSLKEVEIDFRTSTANITLSNEEIIESGDFDYGSSVFFHNKKGYVEKIENADPYIKVINIETTFPSKFVVHIAERQEIYSLSYDNQFLIFDEEFKVLKLSTSRENTMLVEGIMFNNTEIKVGDYLDFDYFPNVYENLYERNYNLGQQTAIIEKITVKDEFDDVINQNQKDVQLDLYNGQTYTIKNSEYGFKYKLQLFLNVFSQIYSLIGQKIQVDGVGEITLTKDNIDNCEIVINNYYDWTSYDEKDCYFNIIPNV